MLTGQQRRANLATWPGLLPTDLASFSGAPLADIEQREVTLDDPALADLHLRHHRPAQGRPCQPSPGDDVDPLVRRHDGRGADDRLYNCLPMYHSVGGVVASGAVLAGGGAVILREKFSASAFWDDVAESGATIFQYIGELCRYLLAGQARSPGARIAAGCAATAFPRDVWEEFQDRFAIPADPGILCRHRRQFLALQCGRQSRLHRPHSALPGASLWHRAREVRRGDDGEPLRGPDGFCMRGRRAAKPARPSARSRAARRVSRAIPTRPPRQRKSCAMCSQPGDACVRTGDLMRQDAQGFFYFVDRIGDTFRWKGENVATTEVAAAWPPIPGVIAANVYGVAVPGHDGKAGMAALETEDGFRPCAHSKPIWRRACRLMRGRLFAAGSVAGRHRNLQAEEAAIWRGRLRSGRDRRSALCRLRRGLCAAGCGALCTDQFAA